MEDKIKASPIVLLGRKVKMPPITLLGGFLGAGKTTTLIRASLQLAVPSTRLAYCYGDNGMLFLTTAHGSLDSNLSLPRRRSSRVTRVG